MPLYTQIVEQESTFLAVPTGIEGSSFALTKITAIKNDPGYVVDETSFTEWRFTGLTRVKGEAYLLGPPEKGRSLAEVLRLPAKDALPHLLRLARALALLTERGIPPFRFQSEAVILLDDGRVLFLPPNLMALMRASRPLDYRLEAYEAINHPYVDGQPGLSYTLAVLAYRVLTGEFPFYAESEDGIRNQVRKLRVTPPHLVRPEVRQDASDLVVRGLTRAGSVSVAQWIEAMEDWHRSGITREIRDEERQEILTRAREHRQKAERNLRSTVFFERNGRLVLIVAAAVIATGFVTGSILRNALAPRSTRGFTPLEVVEAFYTSIGKMDHDTMEDSVIDGAGKGEINEAVNLFVISRQTLAYEGKTYVVNAAEWVAGGRPALDPPSFVHGVADLQITREKDEPEPIFLVEYARYARVFEDQEMESVRPINGRRITDRAYLRRDKEDWVIYRIERVRVAGLEDAGS